MTPAALYVLILIAPFGQRVYTADPPLVLPKDECIAEAERGNADIARTLRRGERTAIRYECEGP